MKYTKPLLENGRLCAGQYQIIERLGLGGFGEAFLAHDTKLDRRVVVKVPNDIVINSLDLRHRFKREVQAMVKLGHPHIVDIYDVGEEDQYPFFVMQYLEGGTLGHVIIHEMEQGTRISPGHLALWLHPIAKALDYLHEEGYIHRDVKPANILYDTKRTGYLSDFGIVKALLAEKRGETVVLTDPESISPGTFEYMAPEIWTGAEQTGAIDQYALAITVYQCLAGAFPFEAEGPNSWQILMNKHLNEPPPPLHEIAPNVTKLVTSEVNRALAKNPQDRFPDCVTFIKSMAKTYADEYEAAKGNIPPPAKKPPAKPKKRRKPNQQGDHFNCPRCDAVIPFNPNSDSLINCSVCSSWIDPKRGVLVDRKNRNPLPPSDVETPSRPIPTPTSLPKNPRQTNQDNQPVSPRYTAVPTAARWILARSKWVMPRLWAIAIPRQVRALFAGPRSQSLFKEDDRHPERRGHDEPLIADHVNIRAVRAIFWIAFLYTVYSLGLLF